MLNYKHAWFCLHGNTNWFLHVRPDTERLQSLAQKQAQEIVETTLCIKDLEDERVLAQNVINHWFGWDGMTLLCAFIKQALSPVDFNSSCVFHNKVEELLGEIKETEAEVVRWREACELEVFSN